MARDRLLSALTAVLVGLGSTAIADMPVLGQVFPSGAIYALPPDTGGPVSWPDGVTFAPLSGGVPTQGRLDRILRDIHPQQLEGAPAAAGRCGRDGVAMAQDGFNVFDPGMPDNCAPVPVAGIYRAPEGLTPGAVLGWDGAVLGSANVARAGDPRPMSAAEVDAVDAYRAAFMAQYRAAFDTAFDPDLSPIGAIPTLADATIIAEFPTEQGLLRLSEWERISITQHIYRHFIVDLIVDGSTLQTVEFTVFQGVLG